jgi:hypothetical protein
LHLTLLLLNETSEWVMLLHHEHCVGMSALDDIHSALSHQSRCNLVNSLFVVHDS